MNKLIISRNPTAGVTLGSFMVVNEDNVAIFAGVTLELPFKDNKQDISCIFTGTYWAHKRSGGQNGDCFELENVIDRKYIQGHIGNFTRDILGCIIFGRSYIDIDDDGLIDIERSKETFDKLLSLLPDRFLIEIK